MMMCVDERVKRNADEMFFFYSTLTSVKSEKNKTYKGNILKRYLMFHFLFIH